MSLPARWMLLILLMPFAAHADEPSPSVEDNIRAMDSDHDGMVTVHEMRVFLETRNGKDYKQDLLDEMEGKAGAKSCASPFSRSVF